MQNELTASTMKNGLVLGILLSVSFLFSVSQVPVLALLTNALFLFSLYLAYKYVTRYRDNRQDNQFSYSQAFVYILLLFVYAGIIAALVTYVYTKFIKPYYLSGMVNDPGIIQTLEIYEKRFPGTKQKVLDEMDELITPTNFAFSMIWVQLLVGALVGAIMAIFVKRDKK